MNKTDKVTLMKNSIGTYNLCRCQLTYSQNDQLLYILDISEKFYFGIEDRDFLLDGFQIRKISDLKKVEIRDDLNIKISRELKLLDGVVKPEVNLSSWKTIFQSIKALNVFMIIENEKANNEDNFFHLCRIKDIKDSYVIISSVDADGIWYDDIKIPYSKITNVMFNDRYSKTWQQYLTK